MIFCNLFVLLLMGTCGVSWGMDMDVDVEKHPFFRETPHEVQNLILEAALDGTEKPYHMKGTGSEYLAIPYTIRPIKPVVYSTVGGARPSSWVPEVNSDILLDHQLWWKKSSGDIRLDEDTASNDDCFTLNQRCFIHAAIDRFLFDGINQKRCALFMLSSNNKSALFFLRQSVAGAGTVKYKDKVEPIVCHDAYIYQAMLHTDENRIVYDLRHGSMPSSSLYIIDVSDDNTVKKVAKKELNMLLTKTIYGGGNTYFGFTDGGKLVRIWLDDAHNINHAMIDIKQYDDATKTYVPSQSMIKDIAIDESCKTEAGLRPRMAYVTTEGEVFVMAFDSAFQKPTPLFNKKLQNPNVFRLFYAKGNLAVLYWNGSRYTDFIADFIVWPDNLGPLYLKTVLAQKMRQQKN